MPAVSVYGVMTADDPRKTSEGANEITFTLNARRLSPSRELLHVVEDLMRHEKIVFCPRSALVH